VPVEIGKQTRRGSCRVRDINSTQPGGPKGIVPISTTGTGEWGEGAVVLKNTLENERFNCVEKKKEKKKKKSTTN